MGTIYTCPNCQNPVVGGTKFCNHCGTSLPYSPQPGVVEAAEAFKWLIYGTVGVGLVILVVAILVAIVTRIIA